jgi:hypothetical protein
VAVDSFAEGRSGQTSDPRQPGHALSAGLVVRFGGHRPTLVTLTCIKIPHSGHTAPDRPDLPDQHLDRSLVDARAYRRVPAEVICSSRLLRVTAGDAWCAGRPSSRLPGGEDGGVVSRFGSWTDQGDMTGFGVAMTR